MAGATTRKLSEQQHPGVVVAQHRRLPHHLLVEQRDRAAVGGVGAVAVPDQVGGERLHPLVHQPLARIDVGDQVDPVDLGVDGEVGRQDGDAERAAELAGEVDESGRLLRLAAARGSRRRRC